MPKTLKTTKTSVEEIRGKYTTHTTHRHIGSRKKTAKLCRSLKQKTEAERTQEKKDREEKRRKQQAEKEEKKAKRQATKEKKLREKAAEQARKKAGLPKPLPKDKKKRIDMIKRRVKALLSCRPAPFCDYAWSTKHYRIGWTMVGKNPLPYAWMTPEQQT